MRVKEIIHESSDPTTSDLADVADWLDTTPDNLHVELKVEPMSMFAQQAAEMLDSFDEFPDDASRTQKISNLLLQGERKYPVYVEMGDPSHFVMEGRHRLVALYTKGYDTILVAYVTRKTNES